MASDSALDRLVRTHLEAALRFAVRLSGDRHHAEEIVQESLLRVARHWHGFRGQSSFRTWWFRILVNVFRSAPRPPPLAELPIECADRKSPDPLAAAAEADFECFVARQVSSLPPRQREVLVLLVYEGFSAAQVADMLGVTQANVHATLHLARKRLKSLLAEQLRLK